MSAEALKHDQVNFKLRPKTHYMDHHAGYVQRGWNPRMNHTFMDEDYMGKLSRMGRICHKKNRDHQAVAKISALRGAEMDVATRAGGTQTVKHDVPWSARRSPQERYPHWLQS